MAEAKGKVLASYLVRVTIRDTVDAGVRPAFIEENLHHLLPKNDDLQSVIEAVVGFNQSWLVSVSSERTDR